MRQTALFPPIYCNMSKNSAARIGQKSNVELSRRKASGLRREAASRGNGEKHVNAKLECPLVPQSKNVPFQWHLVASNWLALSVRPLYFVT